jgi:release factor glutamine methyltransferase
MTIAEALAEAARLGLARLDAQLLLLHALGRPEDDRAWLLAHDVDALLPAVQAAFSDRCRRRASGEPLAYIVGHKEFFGLDLQVDSRVLAPRPDTETLVQWALGLTPEGRRHRIIDLGTGSGAIALALAKSRPDAQIEATDTSDGALQVAAANARALSLDLVFRRGAWLEAADGPYDLIVSNPPYVAQDDRTWQRSPTSRSAHWRRAPMGCGTSA